MARSVVVWGCRYAGRLGSMPVASGGWRIRAHSAAATGAGCRSPTSPLIPLTGRGTQSTAAGREGSARARRAPLLPRGGSAVTGERSLPFLHEQGAPEVDETHLTRSASAAPQPSRSKELRTGSAILAIRGTCSELSASSSTMQRCSSRSTCSPMAPHGDRLRVHSRFRSVRQRGLGA